ncbi:MAG: dihydrolipoamide acetyltransferase family protein [Solirubrobacteraceae bacterium]
MSFSPTSGSLPVQSGMLLDVLMPAMGTSITEATVIGWRKQIGDLIAADETLCEISSDKVDTECPAPAAGRLVEILVQVGETVAVGSVIARIAGDGAPAAAVPAANPAPTLDAARTATDGQAPAPRLSPVVARMLAHHGLDASTIAGSGGGGRITKKDVLAALESPPVPAPALANAAGGQPATAVGGQPADRPAGVPEPLSRIRQTIGARMRASQQTAATCHTMIECDMTAVESARRARGLTALPLVAAATVSALREFPDLNATLDGTAITRYHHVHLGIAVSLGAGGLIVPVVRDAQNLSAEGLGTAIRDLSTRARASRLDPDDVQGATFTITNPGGYGTVFATPVIDLPQVAILDLEAIVRRPVVVTVDGGESIAIRSIVNLILGWDHRAIDGAYAARFLAALRERLETARA